MQILIDRLKSINGGRVLDVATGRGNFINILQQGLKGFNQIIGIDYIDEAILNKACENFPDHRIKLINMDASQMNFADQSFDIVSMSNSLHHLKDANSILFEMLRVLKPGGFFIINEMISDNQSPSQLTYVIMHHWWAKIDTAMGKLHDETWPRHKVVDIVDGLGLESIEIMEFDDPDDPFDKKSLEGISKVIDEYIERAKPLKDFEAFRQEGEEIRQRLFEVGVNGATQVIIIGQKKGNV